VRDGLRLGPPRAAGSADLYSVPKARRLARGGDSLEYADVMQEGRQVRIHAIGRQIDRLHKLACAHNIRDSLPGAPRVGTNPEQLFAAGWSACFESAIGHAAHKRKMTLSELTIDAEVDLHLADGEYFLSALQRQPAWSRARHRQVPDRGAEQICLYSKATRGNIDVAFNLV